MGSQEVAAIAVVVFLGLMANLGRGRAAMLTLGTVAALAVMAAFAARIRSDVREGYYDITSPAFDDEVIPVVLRNLQVKLYVTAYGKNSLTEDSGVWRDISGHADSDRTLGRPQPIVRNLTLLDSTFNFDPQIGALRMKDLEILGPQSVFSGLRGNRDFTLFLYGSIDAGSNPVNIATFYANTESNIGLSLTLSGPSMEIQHTFSSEGLSTVRFPLNMSGALELYSLVRAGNQLTFYKGTGSNAAQHSFSVGGADILLSNKAFEINGDGYWSGSLAVFGITAVAATLTDLVKIKEHIVERQSALIGSVQALKLAQAAAEQKKRCPWPDTTVCTDACPMVKDWTDVGSVLAIATPECRVRLNEACSSAPSAGVGTHALPFCQCWTPESSSTENCRIVRSFFDNTLRDLVSRANSSKCAARLPGDKEPNLSKYYRGSKEAESRDISGPLTMPTGGVTDWYPDVPGYSAVPPSQSRIGNYFTPAHGGHGIGGGAGAGNVGIGTGTGNVGIGTGTGNVGIGTSASASTLIGFVTSLFASTTPEQRRAASDLLRDSSRSLQATAGAGNVGTGNTGNVGIGTAATAPAAPATH